MERKKFTYKDDSLIRQRLLDGVSIKAVAEELGVSYESVYARIARLRAHGFLPEKRR